MKVGVPQPLRAYTDQRADVEASGESHVRIFVNREQVRRLDVALAPSDEVHIFQALSGG